MLRITSLICLLALLTANAERLYSEESLIGTVTGTVVSESGAPVDGADVLILLDVRPDLVASPQQLLVRGQTDPQGSFALPVPRSLVFSGAIHQSDEFHIWVSHPEAGWTVTRTEGRLPSADLKLSLIAPEAERLTVLTPGGRPASGIEVTMTEVKLDDVFSPVPEFLRERFAAATDEQGQVKLPAISRDELLGAEFRSERFGIQTLYWPYDRQFSEEVTLRSVASVTGRVEGNLPAGRTYDEIKFTLGTSPIERNIDVPFHLGIAEVRVGRDGAFSVPALATGVMFIEAKLPDDFPAVTRTPDGIYVSRNSNVRMTVSLQPAARVTGLILDPETRFPIPDVRVVFARSYDERFRARTDESGQFAIHLPPNDYYLGYSLPSPYHSPEDEFRERVLIPQNATEFELPPPELLKGKTLTGRVTDPDGNPVSGMFVSAIWRQRNSSGKSQIASLTDEHGEFVLEGVHPTAALRIQPLVNAVPVSDSIQGNAGEILEPIEFVYDANDLVSLTGKIVDDQGEPVPGADYQINAYSEHEFRRDLDVNGIQLKVSNELHFGNSIELHRGRTAADGTFKTPRKFIERGRYFVRTYVDGDYAGGSSLTPRESETNRFTDVVQTLDRKTSFREKPKYNPPSRVSFSAHVTNQQGAAIPDAKVVIWTLGKRLQLRTDEQGRFHMPKVFKHGLWLFVDAEGYRFFGEFVKPAGVVHRIALIRADEPAGPPMKTITDPVDEEVLAQARQDFMQFMEHCHEVGDKRHKHELMGLLPRLDPDLGLRCLEDPRFDASDMRKASSREWHRNRVRYYATMQYLKSDVRKAGETARLMTTGTFRVSTLCKVAKQLPDAEQQFRNDLLSDALSTARAIEDPVDRLQGLHTVASALIDLGETDRGQIVLHEAIRLANKPLPENLDERLVESAKAYRAFIARKLALFDLPAALELIPEADKEYTVGRYYGGVAEAIADRNPAEAEQVLERVPEGWRSTWAVRICYPMAKTDYKQARQLSETIGNPILRFYCWGAMSHAIAERDPEKAKELLTEAFDELAALVDSGQRGGNSSYTPLKAAICLLPVVEQVDPDRLREYFWRTLSFRQNANIGKETTGLGYLGTDPVLGAFLVRYDRHVADVLIRPDYDWLSPNVDEWRYFLFGGLAAVDPAEAVHLVSQLPEKTDYDRTLKLEAWNEIVPLLVNRGNDGWNYLKDNQYLFREIDDLDL